MLFPIPATYGPSKRRIVIEYQRVREESRDKPIVATIAANLGYTLDKNGSNSFVNRVVQEYLSDISDKGLGLPVSISHVLVHGTGSITIEPQEAGSSQDDGHEAYTICRTVSISLAGAIRHE